MPDKLRGLPGLNRLSAEERRKFYLDNADKLREFEEDPILYDKAAERLYDNQMFKNKFGAAAFKQARDSGISYENRNEALRNTIINDEFSRKFSPIGLNGKRNNNIGLGSNWETYNEMSSEGKLKLLESDYKTPQQLQEEQKQRTGFFDRVADFFLGDAIQQHKVESNDKILQKIYNEEADKAGERFGAEINEAYYNPEITGRTDKETKDLFVKAITPNSYVDSFGNPNTGVAEYAARYGSGKENEISSEMEDFTVDDMRRLLAKKAVYEQYLSPQMATTALNNEAKRYIKEHQGTLKTLGLFGKDVLIATTSYLVDKANGLYDLVLMAQDKTSGLPTVYLDDEGTVVDPYKNKIYKTGQGEMYYMSPDGKRHTVHQQQIARTTLHNMGKNMDGSDDDSWMNPQYWTRAEQFGTFDEDLQLQYEKLGASPYKVAYDPNDDSDLMYESFKMMSFGIADGLSMLIPFGVGMAGRALSMASKAGKAGRTVGKILNKAGTAFSAQSKFGRGFQGIASAGGIAYAYQRGAFQETLAKNLANAEEAMINASREDVMRAYQTDANYRQTMDAIINDRAKERKSVYMSQMDPEEASKLSDEKLDEVFKLKAQEEVFSEFARNEMENRKASGEYSDLLNKAIDEAGDAATNIFLLDGIKYGIVNTVGYRKFLFNHPTSLAQKASKNFKGLVNKELEGGKKRLALDSKFSTYKGKAKQFGKVLRNQAWGGAWTNGTDDMMVDAAERINDDAYSRYLNSYANGESLADTYGLVEGLHSYWHGLNNSLGQETTWNAATVGGLGSIVSATPHFANIAHLATKEGREAYRNNFKKRIKRDENGIALKDEKGEYITEDVKWTQNGLDRLGYLIQNGVLNTYYGAKQNETVLQQHADYVNSFLDDHQDFEDIKDLIGAAQGVDAANSKGDTRTMQYIHALKTMKLLEKVGNNENDPRTISETIQEAKTLVDRLAALDPEKGIEESESISEQELENLKGQYYKNNPTLDHSEENDQMAIKDIIKNAKMLKEAAEAYKEADKKVDKLVERGKDIKDDVRDKMNLTDALVNHWEKRRDTMQSEIGDLSTADTEVSLEDFLASLGGRKVALAQISIYEQQTKELEKEKNAASNLVARTEVEYKRAQKEATEAKEGDELGAFEAFERAYEAKAKALDAEQRIKYWDDLIAATNEKSQKIKDALAEQEKNKSKDKVLTADEIFALDPISRARMLNDENISHYTKRQQREIQKLKDRFSEEDLEKIQDIALLTRRIATNKDAYNRMAKNPEAASQRLEAQRVVSAAAAYKVINARNAQIAANYITKAVKSLSARKDISKEQLSDFVYKSLRTLNSEFLDTIDEEGLLYDHHKELQNARSWGRALEDINAIIKNSDTIGENKSEILRDVVENIGNSFTREEIMTSLEKAVDNLKESSPQRSKEFEEILKGLEYLGYVRDHTVLESREERKKREEDQQKREDEAKKKMEEGVASDVANAPAPEETSGTEAPVNSYVVNEDNVGKLTIDDYLKIHPEAASFMEEANIKYYKEHPEVIQTQFRDELDEAINYLNGKSAPAEFLKYLNRDSDEHIDSLNKEKQKELADKYVRDYLLYLSKEGEKAPAAEVKQEKAAPSQEAAPKVKEDIIDADLEERFQELKNALTEKFKQEHTGFRNWINVSMKSGPYSPIITVMTYEGALDWQGETSYQVNADGTIGTSDPLLKKFFKPYMDAIPKTLEVKQEQKEEKEEKQEGQETQQERKEQEKQEERIEKIEEEKPEVKPEVEEEKQQEQKEEPKKAAEVKEEAPAEEEKPSEEKKEEKKEEKTKTKCPVCGAVLNGDYHKHEMTCPQCNSDLSIYKQVAELSEEEAKELAEKLGLTSPTGQSLQSLMEDGMPEASITKGRLWYGIPSNAKQGDVTVSLTRSEDGSTRIISFTVDGNSFGLRVGDDAWKVTSSTSDVFTQDDLDVSDVEKGTPFVAEFLNYIEGKWYFTGGFEGDTKLRNLEVRDSFNLEEALGNYIQQEKIRLVADGAPIKSNNVETVIVDGEKMLQINSDSLENIQEQNTGSRELPSVDTVPDIDTLNEKISSKSVDRKTAFLSGNGMQEYTVDTDKGILGRKAEHKEGKAGDSMSNFFDWLRKGAKIKLQNIIDDELPQIIANNPHKKIKFMISRPGKLASGVKIDTHLMLVMEVDADIRKIHSKYNNGDFIKNGKKEYLLVGVAGAGNFTDNPDYNKINNLKALLTVRGNSRSGIVISKGLSEGLNMKDYFAKNTERDFFIPDNLETEVVPGSQIPGYIVQSIDDFKVDDYVPISQLLEDREGKGTNPHRLSLSKLGWIIVQYEKYMPIKTGGNDFMILRDQTKNAGNTFALVPASNGKMVAMYIKPCRYTEINAGSIIKNRVDHLIEVIGDPKTSRNQKVEAFITLSADLYFNAEADNILISPSGTQITLERKVDGEKRDVFLNEEGYTIDDFKKAMEWLNPRVNLTPGSFSTTDRMKEYEEAGALSVRSAKLGTIGSSYSIFALDSSSGQMMVPETYQANKGASDIRMPEVDQIFYKGKLYQELDGTFAHNNVVISPEAEPELVEALEYNMQIKRGDLRATSQEGSWLYYIVVSGEHPKVIKVKNASRDYEVVKLSEQESKDYIEKIRKEREEKAREEAAKEKMEEERKAEEKKEQKLEEEMPETVETQDEVLPEEEEMQSEKNPEEAQKQQPAQQPAKQEETSQKEEKPIKQEEEKPAPKPLDGGHVDFTTLYHSPEYSPAIRKIIKKKWPNAPKDEAGLQEFLKKKNIQMSGIGSSKEAIKAWLKTLNECR